MSALLLALRTGIALAITVGVAYAACSFVFWLWPQAAGNFMTALFHGLDFSRLQAAPAAFSFGGFSYALGMMVVWAFVFGTLFGWLSRRG